MAFRMSTVIGLAVGCLASSAWALIPGQTSELPQDGKWSGQNWNWQKAGVYKWNSWFDNKWWGGSAVAIAPNYILTANHVGHQPTDYLEINGVKYHAIAYFNVPASLGAPDIQVIKVDGTLPVYKTIFTGELKKGTPVTLIGYGMTGTIADGKANEVYVGDQSDPINSPVGIRRWGTNLLSKDADSRFHIGLDDTMTDYEAMPGGGDSGGGMFVKVGDQWQLAGTITETDGGIALPKYAKWINSVTGVPEPTTGAIFLLAPLLLMRNRRTHAGT